MRGNTPSRSAASPTAITAASRSRPIVAGSACIARIFATRLDTRMPSFATHFTRRISGSAFSSHFPPSRSSQSPAASVAGTPEWCSATTSQASLNTGEPEEPGLVSPVYCASVRRLSGRRLSVLSRNTTCLRSPSGCWTMLTGCPRRILPSAPTSGRWPKSSIAAPSAPLAATATSVKSRSGSGSVTNSRSGSSRNSTGGISRLPMSSS